MIHIPGTIDLRTGCPLPTPVASAPPTKAAVFFPFAACLYPIGFGLVLWGINRPATLRLGLGFFALVASLFACFFAVQASLQDPWILLKIFTHGQVSEQLRSPWLVDMSVTHFSMGDVSTLFLITYVSRVRLGMPMWQLALYLPGLMHCTALGVLPWLLTPSVRRYLLDGTVPRK